MSKLQAGVSRIALQPKIGTDLIGYSQKQETLGIHDPIHARALVLENENTTIALCSIEVCFFLSNDVSEMRSFIAERCPIPADNIFFFATHTHSAPIFFDPENWVKSPLETATEAVVTAYQSRQPAKLGMGYGQLQGYSINRRFMNRPVDPSISVIRVDTADGKPLSILGNYGNHAVVMGYDNVYVSGDWPGYSSRRLESEFGGDFVALFGQGGAGDVNPLTETVRQNLSAGHPVEAIGSTSTMYGKYDGNDVHSWNIGDRAGGRFIEAETIAIAYNTEVMRVWRGIQTTDEIELWTQSVSVSGLPSDDEPPIPATPQLAATRERFQRILSAAIANNLQMEVMMVGIGDAVLVGHPGETFSENSVALRKICQQMGISHPILVTYANGWFSYLTPENAYPEGGYEVGVAQGLGLSRKIQDRIMDTILPHLQARADRRK
jgi:hypothetical protein